MGNTKLYAHTPNEKGEWHLLDEHLHAVAMKAKKYAEAFNGGNIAYVVGLLHDVGKINPNFQRYLLAQAEKRVCPSVPHAIWGAAFLYKALEKQRKDLEDIALAIYGHHAGIQDSATAPQFYLDFLDKNPSSLRDMANYLKTLRIGESLESLRTELELFVRMIFSALVDADYLDTERHFSKGTVPLQESEYSISDLWSRFEQNQATFVEDRKNKTDANVFQIRQSIYQACLAAAEQPTGFFRLTVPTGGGKTRSGLAFALRHAMIHHLRRVVVAIPYTSIIDQTAQTYREILGDEYVLEHHSAMEPEDKKEEQNSRAYQHRLATENWDAPLIVTTTVQLFESIFSNRPSKVRKIHRLAKSVILLDEAQTLPTHLLIPTLDVLKAFTKDYGVTVVFSTATQPAFEESRWTKLLEDVEIREIIPKDVCQSHFQCLKRVRYERRPKPISWDELAEELNRKHHQAMVVLNSRKDALDLLDALNNDLDVFHLSTLLCVAHRRKVIKEIKERLDLENPRPICLVSTQVVEAGLDFDFPIVFRALGPLDRIVQAAGRCNREGMRTEKGRVIIFEPADGRAPKGAYKIGIEKSRFLLHDKDPEELHNPDIYREYFRLLFDDLDLDVNKIQDLRREKNYPEVARLYRMIEQNTVPVVVPYGDSEERLSAWMEHPCAYTWRQLQPYVVNLYPFEIQRHSEVIEPLSSTLYRWCGAYDEIRGLAEAVEDPADLIVDEDFLRRHYGIQ